MSNPTINGTISSSPKSDESIMLCGQDGCATYLQPYRVECQKQNHQRLYRTDSKTLPELEKLKAVHEDSQKIGEFLDWLLNGKGYYLCECPKNRFYPTLKTIEDLLAQYFKIDLKKAEQERRTILDNIRTQRKPSK